MATVFDVAAYILEKQGQMTAMKLQKLVYYSQAWSLVWDDEPIFLDPIEAWANGPVVPALFAEHRGKYTLLPGMITKGNRSNLTEKQKETLDAVLSYYGGKSGQWLSELTHNEAPWRKAREGLAPTDRSSREITHANMAEYYESLLS
jgi:uncharacterized phage-associated protein